MADETKKVAPAYVPYRTFKNAIRELEHVPDRIDRSLFPTMGGSTQNQFFAALRFFKLTDDAGVPTRLFKDLAGSTEQEWKNHIANLIHSHYAEQVKLFKTGTAQQLRESFGDVGGSVVAFAVRFLLAAAKDAGLLINKHITNAAGVRRRGERRETIKSSNNGGDEQEQQQQNHNPVLKELISKFPTMDPNWDDKTKQAWFESYQKLLGATLKGGDGV